MELEEVVRNTAGNKNLTHRLSLLKPHAVLLLRLKLQEIIKNTLLNLVYEICCKCKYCLVISHFSKVHEMEEIV